MSFTPKLGIAGVFGLLALTATAAEAAKTPTGVWLDHTGRGAVEITQCGKSLCGRIVWVKNKSNSKLCGKKIIGGVKRVGSGRWDKGWIYSPERGSRFDVELKPLRSGKLRVLGYAGVKFLSETMIWKPAPSDLERCDRVASKTPVNTPAQTPTDKAAVEAEKKLPGPATADTKAPAASSSPSPIDGAYAPTPKQPAPEKKKTSEKDKSEPPKKTAQAGTYDDKADDDEESGPSGRKSKTCTMNFPYVSVSFPCPN